MKKNEEIVALADAAIAEAERCRLEARAAIAKDPDRYAALSGQPSGWCVVTQGGLWSRQYHDRLQESRLRDCVERGHKIILTVGLVAKSDSPLDAHNHVAAIAVTDSKKIPAAKLAMITVRAKLHAACALSS